MNDIKVGDFVLLDLFQDKGMSNYPILKVYSDNIVDFGFGDCIECSFGYHRNYYRVLDLIKIHPTLVKLWRLDENN